MRTNNQRAMMFTVLVAALGYFVDIYDLVLFSIVRIPSLKSLGVASEEILNSVKPELVQKAIDNCDAKTALEVLKKAKMPDDLMERIKKKYEFNFSKSWGLVKA